MNVTVIDYANSNALSILRAMDALGVTPRFSRSVEDIASADAIILPGVGHTGTAMGVLRSEGLIVPLEDAVLRRRVPVLGICLGMHIMVDHVEEGDCAGLGWVNGRAVELKVGDRQKYKVPHMGWNTVAPSSGVSRLLPPTGEEPSYYFCHKYTVENLAGADSTASFHYEHDGVAIFEKGNIFGVQFHPEKSQDAGQALFRRFFEAR